MNNQKPQTGGYAGSTIGALLRVARQAIRGLTIDSVCRVGENREAEINRIESKLTSVIAGLPTREEVYAAVTDVKDALGVDAAVACYIHEVGNGRAKMADIPEEMYGIVMRNCRQAMAKADAVKQFPPPPTPHATEEHEFDWFDFLAARSKIIDVFYAAGSNDEQIAKIIGTDPVQTRLIRTRDRSIDYMEAVPAKRICKYAKSSLTTAALDPVFKITASFASVLDGVSKDEIDNMKSLLEAAVKTDYGRKNGVCQQQELAVDRATLRDEIAMRVSAADCEFVFGDEYLDLGYNAFRRAQQFAEARYKIADATIAARTK